MDAAERVKKLFEQAKTIGLPFPSAGMIEDSIRDAEWDALYKPLEVSQYHHVKPHFMKEVWKRANEKVEV
jgi:hypothetical protein